MRSGGVDCSSTLQPVGRNDRLVLQPGRLSIVTRFAIPATALILAAAVPASAAPQTAAPVVTKPVTPPSPTRAQLQQVLGVQFKGIDGNGDGSLSVAEITAAESKVLQQRIAAIRARAEGQFAQLDTNKDGQLSKAEFMAITAGLKADTPDGKAALTALDSNKDGKVSVDEFRARPLAQFDSADTNHDGTISPAEADAIRAAAKR
jgi:hypothetical protein